MGAWTSGWRNGEREERVQVGGWIGGRTEGWMDGTVRQMGRRAARGEGWMHACMQAGGKERRQASNARLRNPNFLRGSGSHCMFLSRGMMEHEDCWRHY